MHGVETGDTAGSDAKGNAGILEEYIVLYIDKVLLNGVNICKQ